MTQFAPEMQETIALFAAGRLAEADQACEELLAARHPDFSVLHLAGAIKASIGHHQIALDYFNAAIAQNPAAHEVYRHRSQTELAMGLVNEALQSLEQSLSISPDNAGTLLDKGILFTKMERFEDAFLCFTAVLRLEPRNPGLLNDTGLLLYQMARFDEAIGHFDRALSIDQDNSAAHFNKGNVLRSLSRNREALQCYERAIACKADFHKAWHKHGNTLIDLGQPMQALASFDRALALKADYPEALNNRGGALRELGRATEALTFHSRAIALAPGLEEAHNDLGNALRDLGRFSEAAEAFRRAIGMRPGNSIAHIYLGNALGDLGRPEDAIASYREAIRLEPKNFEAYSNLLFAHSYNTFIDPQQYLSLSRGWEQAYISADERNAARDKVMHRAQNAGRKLRIGYVSGDFRGHAVSYFIEHLFRHHDRMRVEIFAYPTHSGQDEVTKRLRNLADRWEPSTGLSDHMLVERIGADAIDVLVDLSGHTAHNRLGVFARRAAPVQAHYLGFFASTGLTEMDYWIGDAVLTPTETDGQFSETLWRLPRTWVSYEGKTSAPTPVSNPPPDRGIRIGSFNNLGKLTPSTLALWSRLLLRLPQAKLLLKTKQLAEPANRQRIFDAMRALGIAADRIELHDGADTPDWLAHMAYYSRLDIALDPVGSVGGGTTTCDALWMAVPVVTLIGDRMATRMTASMLAAVGREEWIARSEEEYIEKVVALADDADRRRALRASLRQEMAVSPLCDASGLARALEDAYFSMFDRWRGTTRSAD